MKLAFISITLGAVSVAAQQVLPPITPPSYATTDPRQCATENMASLVNVPATPTGDLLSAMYSHGSKIVTKCTATTDFVELCPIPPATSWCAFSTAILSSLSSDFASYVSSNRDFWTARSSTISVVAAECPRSWWNALLSAPNLGDWFTQAVYHAECNIAATPTPGLQRPAKVESASTTTTAAMRSALTGSAVSLSGSSTASAVRPTSSTSGADRSKAFGGILGF